MLWLCPFTANPQATASWRWLTCQPLSESKPTLALFSSVWPFIAFLGILFKHIKLQWSCPLLPISSHFSKHITPKSSKIKNTAHCVCTSYLLSLISFDRRSVTGVINQHCETWHQQINCPVGHRSLACSCQCDVSVPGWQLHQHRHCRFIYRTCCGVTASANTNCLCRECWPIYRCQIIPVLQGNNKSMFWSPSWGKAGKGKLHDPR